MSEPQQQPDPPGGVREAASAHASELAEKIICALLPTETIVAEDEQRVIALLLPTLEALHEQITTLEQRHAAVMLHTQGVVDENTILRNAGEGLKGALDDARNNPDLAKSLCWQQVASDRSDAWSAAVRGNGGGA